MATEFVSISEKNSFQINAFIAEHWFSTDMIIRGKIVDMTKVDGLVTLESGEITGLLTYTILLIESWR